MAKKDKFSDVEKVVMERLVVLQRIADKALKLWEKTIDNGDSRNLLVIAKSYQTAMEEIGILEVRTLQRDPTAAFPAFRFMEPDSEIAKRIMEVVRKTEEKLVEDEDDIDNPLKKEIN
jgi:hypothetical protein